MNCTVEVDTPEIEKTSEMDGTAELGVEDDAEDLSDDDGTSSVASSEYDQSFASNNVVDQLLAAGTVGAAAAAAIASGIKRRKPYSFEMNPTVRKRHQTRILRKLKETMNEYTRRVGQQAVVLLCTPGKIHNSYKVFGAKPLEDVLRDCKGLVMQELEHALAQQTPTIHYEDKTLYELPPLVIEGIPTAVEEMSQAQLRTFIPLMMKYATGRGKPGWGKESMRPAWWPSDTPWANIRSDVRTEEEKRITSWTQILREIVLSCYKHHNRLDLLPSVSGANQNMYNTNDDKNETDKNTENENVVQSDYTPTVLKTIQHADGTLSIVHVHTDGSVVTFAEVQTDIEKMQNMAAEATHAVQTLADAATENLDGNVSDVQAVATLTEARLNEEGQLIFTRDDGQQSYPLLAIPVSMIRNVAANINQDHESQMTDDETQIQVVIANEEGQQKGQTESTAQLPVDKMDQTS